MVLRRVLPEGQPEIKILNLLEKSHEDSAGEGYVPRALAFADRELARKVPQVWHRPQCPFEAVCRLRKWKPYVTIEVFLSSWNPCRAGESACFQRSIIRRSIVVEITGIIYDQFAKFQGDS